MDKSTTTRLRLFGERTLPWTSGGKIVMNCTVRHQKAVPYSVLNIIAGQSMDEDALPRKILAGELYYAKLWLVCVALRGVSWDKMPFEQRELAFQAKDAAAACLSNLLNSPTYRAALRYAVHDSLVTAAFSGLFLLKMANLFPAEVDLPAIIGQVEQLSQVLSDVAAERSVSSLPRMCPRSSRMCRYALTLRIMLANLRRKMGMVPPGVMAPPADPTLMVPQFMDPNLVPGPVPPPLTMAELGLQWSSDREMFSPSAIPVWLQEQVRIPHREARDAGADEDGCSCRASTTSGCRLMAVTACSSRWRIRTGGAGIFRLCQRRGDG